MPAYTFECKTHGEYETILPITANLDKQKCPECKKAVEYVFVRTSPPKLLGGGFHATSYPNSAYKGT